MKASKCPRCGGNKREINHGDVCFMRLKNKPRRVPIEPEVITAKRPSRMEKLFESPEFQHRWRVNWARELRTARNRAHRDPSFANLDVLIAVGSGACSAGVTLQNMKQLAREKLK